MLICQIKVRSYFYFRKMGTGYRSHYHRQRRHAAQTEVEKVSHRLQQKPIKEKLGKRAIYALLLATLFGFTIVCGPFYVMLGILCIQIQCFREVLSTFYSYYQAQNTGLTQLLPWYFLITTNYYFLGEFTPIYFEKAIQHIFAFQFIIFYHRLISFTLYMIGLIWFTLRITPKHSTDQFCFFAWIHASLVLIIPPSYLAIHNTFQGIIWLIITIVLTNFNDIGAYFIGKYCGKTPLISVSPRKTVEGFIGGAITCMTVGPAIAICLCPIRYLVCPMEYGNELTLLNSNCEPSYIFTLQDYEIYNIPFRTYPFLFHTFNLSIFAALIGPFGGFFASGFKRAFKIKDFGGTLPGHGGILDRFDCQYLMVPFAYVYIHSFLKEPHFQELIDDRN